MGHIFASSSLPVHEPKAIRAWRVPFVKPALTGNEAAYVAAAIAEGSLAGDGPYTKRCEALLERVFGANRILLTTSGTSALEMAAMLCDIEAGDEVIMPSYTFTSTANAFLLRGAKPVFVDIRPDTMNIDESAIEAAITSRTRALVPVHYGGVACEMDSIRSIARRHGLRIVEDAAQAVNASYRDKFLGTLGDLGVFSFHATKNVVCGEGGALLCNDPALTHRAEIIREKGTNRSQFIRGQVDKYTWTDMGSSFVPSDLLAAFLVAQIEHMDEITRNRERVYREYQTLLEPLAQRGVIVLPEIASGCRSNFHLFRIITRDSRERADLLDYLNGRGYQATFHYVPLHTSPMGKRLGYREGMLPVTETLSARVLRLPLYAGLESHLLLEVVEAIRAFYGVRSI